jgi:hypothetical protein
MIIRREYLDAVRKKSFWIGTLLFPLIMGLLFAVPLLLSNISPDEQKRIVVIDSTGRLGEPLREGLADEVMGDGQPRYLIELVPPGDSLESTRREQERRIWAEGIYGVLTIGDDLNGDDNFRFASNAAGSTWSRSASAS